MDTVRRQAEARRRHIIWVAAQLLAVPFLALASSLVIQMTFAIPNGSYIDESGVLVTCEALSPRGKRWHSPGCARFGSKETNPTGYALAWLGVLGVGSFLYLSTRPGRGFRFSRH